MTVNDLAGFLEHLTSLRTQRADIFSARERLGLEFPPEEAEKQLAIAIDWGRYAKLIAFEHSAGMIYLETETVSK